MGLASAGAACAAALSVCTAARLTSLSSSLNGIEPTNLGSTCANTATAFDESSAFKASAAYFIASTDVARVLASPLETFSASAGARDDASPTANKPRHSATTLRTPSSSLPALANRISSVRLASSAA